MNIKSLLLGSAAALVVATGARAADAVVVAEPEPMDYVKVCDMYGVGFFYIPGTETCLKLSGYFRYDIGVGDLNGLTDVLDKKDYTEDEDYNFNDTYYKLMRFQLNVDAREETEYGTLQGFAALRFNWKIGTHEYDDSGYDSTYEPSFDGVDVNVAVIRLGGLEIGKNDSLFTTWTGYAGSVIDDTLVPYGPFDTTHIQYTFTSGAFSAAAALETGYGDTYTIDSYVPDVVGAVGYDGGKFKITAVAGYDSVWEEWAAKVRLDVQATDTISAFIMGGWQSADGDSHNNFYGNWGGDWAVWGGLSAGIGEKATFNLQLSYDDAETFGAAANIDYKLTPNLHVRPEIDYVNQSGEDDAFGGWLRFQYNFGG